MCECSDICNLKLTYCVLFDKIFLLSTGKEQDEHHNIPVSCIVVCGLPCQKLRRYTDSMFSFI